ncbi:sporulation protein YqfD [Haloplasma contractile]|uniref:Stage IV sporulation YqfD protein n=1 Tax=Haloplasma contractile SSD-17B TaxID=1033810 RepID=U2EGU2_9MOLU|nr:sporulation protein YqfD [Haloplasma contractile]ERJ13826.1 Putative stage IV sporulation YqfD protein [Haloplasma contractile SSD-17B]
MKDRVYEFSEVSVILDQKDLKRLSKKMEREYNLKKIDQNKVEIRIPYLFLKSLKKEEVDYKIKRFYGPLAWLKILKHQPGVVIGIVLFLFILYFNTLTIKDITFSTNTNQNDKIEDMINAHIDERYMLSFLNGDLHEINLELRKEFSDFEWISVSRNGTNLHVTILEPSIVNHQVQYMDGAGDLVADFDGVIKQFQVAHGIPLVNHNQYVSKGSVIVTGNLRHNNTNNEEEEEHPFYIPAQGKVFAEVWHTKTVEIPKEEQETKYTGKIYTEKIYNAFGFDINLKKFNNHYEQFDQETTEQSLTIFSLKLPFSLKKIHYYEKDVIIREYDQTSSKKAAKSLVKKQITSHFEDEIDEILDLYLVNEEPQDDSYRYTFFVRTYENIAKFQRRNEDEQLQKADN